MHFAISATWGPTDPTRAALPFIFAASALQAGDTVTLMLFHDSVHMATQGTAAKIVPFGPPARVEEVLSHAGAKVLVCKPCAAARCLNEANLDKRVSMAGMNEFHAAAARENARVVCF
ncbi:MAG TPA: DsrE family protein [Steroidobacteraceae bacterium]|nr:DsrE family protein [Steroidobacteraceae bacterium]